MKYKQKYHTAVNIAVGVTLIALSCVWAAYSFYQTGERSKKYAESLLETQNIMVWTMDESCYQQLKNGEGVIRLTIK